MCQRGLTVTAILILVGCPPGRRASKSNADTRTTIIPIGSPSAGFFPLATQLDETPVYVGDISNIIDSLTNAESTEEQQGYTYNSYYAPSTVNFHDIYSNSLAMLAEDPVLTTTKDDDFHLNNMPTKFVEFHPNTLTIPPVTAPPPMFLLNSSMLKTEEAEEKTSTTSTTTTTTTTTEEPEELNIKVIPIKKDYQRGVLDLLFPAARVRTFKSVFDTFRRLMSHTFR